MQDRPVVAAPPLYALRIAAFFGGYFVLGGVALPFFPVWLEARGLTETEIVEQLREPLAPHVGEVRTFETNWLESGQYGADVMVYDVDGSLGKGRVVVLHPGER